MHYHKASDEAETLNVSNITETIRAIAIGTESIINGKELSEITKKTHLKVGDLITVRIEIRTDRNMEFIHMKDMRASGLEPINVLSSYKWKDGLGYYQSTKDASTNFFFDMIPKGIYVFEYDLRVNNKGLSLIHI